MARRYLFRKWDKSQEYASCWYCGSKTLFYIFDTKKGEEFFCCPNCANKKHRIKKLSRYLKNYSLKPKKAIISEIPFVKNSENAQEGKDYG